MATKKTCLYPGCDLPVKTRGLCNSHYQGARAAIAKGDATEEDLIARNLMTPKREKQKFQHDAFLLGSAVTGQANEIVETVAETVETLEPETAKEPSLFA